MENYFSSRAYFHNRQQTPIRSLAGIVSNYRPPISQHATNIDSYSQHRQYSDAPICEKDQQWLNHWLSQRHIIKKKPIQQTQNASIPEIKQDLRRAMNLLQSVQNMKMVLEESRSLPTWEALTPKITNIQTEIETLLQKLHHPVAQTALKAKLRKIQKKRNWLKHRKEKMKTESIKREKIITEKTLEIEKQQKLEQQKLVLEKKKEELDVVITACVRDIKHQQSEATSYLRVLDGLEKLREARKHKHSSHTSASQDDKFNTALKSLRGMLRRQLKCYNSEEKRIRLKLTHYQRNHNQEQLKQQIKLRLFGEPPSECDLIFPYYKKFTDVDDVNSLINVRCRWDEFLVSADHPLGSGIPVDWVYPVKPSSEEWSKYEEKLLSKS